MENLGEFGVELFDPKSAEIKKQEYKDLANKYKDLVIEGVDDKEGYKKLHSAEQVLVKIRTGMDKTRKEYIKPYQERVSGAMDLQKELLAEISPVEKTLKVRKGEYLAEVEKIKEEKQRKKREALQKRVNILNELDFVHTDLLELSKMSETDFEKLVSEKKEIFEIAEEERLKKAEIDLKNELKLKILQAKDQAELNKVLTDIERCGFIHDDFESEYNSKKSMLEHEAEKAKLEEEKRKLQEEKYKLANEKLEKERKEAEDKRVEEAKKEATEKAEKEAEEKRVADEKARVEKEKADAEAKEKKEAEEKEALEKKEKEEQAEIEKRGKYKEFLEKNGINNSLIATGEIKMMKNEKTKQLTFYKKIGTFNF